PLWPLSRGLARACVRLRLTLDPGGRRHGRPADARRGAVDVIVCVSPNPSIDKLFAVERLAPGAIHRPVSFVRVPGGKGLNVARSAATLGAEGRAVALLGGQHGRWIADELEARGLPRPCVWQEGDARHGASGAGGATGWPAEA